jgi:hypothetical protein
MLQQQAGMGMENPAHGMIGAMQPIYDRNLQQSQAALNASAPGRFGSAHTSQGIGLHQNALQDFNMFQQQAHMQGAQLQHQQQQLAQQAMQLMGGLQNQGFQQQSQMAGMQLAPLMQLLGMAAPQNAIVNGYIPGQPGDPSLNAGPGGFQNASQNANWLQRMMLKPFGM